MINSETKDKYWYKKRKAAGTELPDKYKRLFANKQVVCIEYSNLTDDDEREIFRVSGMITIYECSLIHLSILACPVRHGSQRCRFFCLPI